MNLHIRPFSPDDMEEVVQLSLGAWTPVYHSFEQVLGPTIYSLLFPDWKKTQRAIVFTRSSVLSRLVEVKHATSFRS